jgi:deoxyribonuclease-2
LSTKTVKDSDSIFGQTLADLYKAKTGKYAQIMYNDAPPEEGEGKESSHWAHAKGVIGMNKNEGFWLIHSIPKFAEIPTHKYDYPDSGRDNGQTAMCISFNAAKEGADIVNQLLMMRPNIYLSETTAEVTAVAPNIEQLIAKKWPKGIDQDIKEITSVKGINFQSFARNSKQAGKDGDLYSKFIAPALKTNLLVETWRRGAGNPLESECKTAKHANNIKTVKLTFTNKGASLPSSTAWEYIKDHAKWAVSADEKSPFSCVGDINRMESQFKRGGGTVCLNHKDIWSTMKGAIVEVEPCSK